MDEMASSAYSNPRMFLPPSSPSPHVSSMRPRFRAIALTIPCCGLVGISGECDRSTLLAGAVVCVFVMRHVVASASSQLIQHDR